MQDKKKISYRQQFASPEESSSYDRKEYHPSSYSSLLWEIEKEQLTGAIRKWCSTDLPKARHLDFACGTGRVLSSLETLMGGSMGIEISQQMARLALQKVSCAEVRCVDITVGNSSVEFHGQFDVITAFRFILNAEPSLRDSAFSHLRNMLASDQSVLIFNNHGNLFSHKALLWPYHALRMRADEYRTSGNYLTHAEVLSLVSRHGFVVVEKMGCGFFSAKMMKVLPYRWALAAERWLSRTPLNRFSVNQMYVVRRKHA